jgi:hypothetical protein
MSRLARLAWIVLVLFVLVTLLSAANPRFAQLRTDPYGFGDAYTTLGITINQFSIYFISIEIVFALLFGTVGVIIFWKAHHDNMAVLVSAAFIAMGSATPLPEALIPVGPVWELIVLALRAAGIGLMLLFLFLFPNGRFVPLQSRWLGFVALGYLASWFVFPDLVPPVAILAEATDQSAAVQYAPMAILTILGMVSQLYRYFKVSDAIQRQQTKWVLMGIVGFIFIELVSLILFALIPSFRNQESDQLLFVILFGPLLLIGVALIPSTTAVAMMRYRLWDISLVVRRTLVYGLLTAVLAMAYFGSVTLLQGLITIVAGQQSAVAIVVSTLIIAALFTPARRRLQGLIDRRFYRRKYDAGRVLATFARTARDEVDLARVEAELLAAVRETMQPEHISLWLKPR